MTCNDHRTIIIIIVKDSRHLLEKILREITTHYASLVSNGNQGVPALTVNLRISSPSKHIQTLMFV